MVARVTQFIVIHSCTMVLVKKTCWSLGGWGSGHVCSVGMMCWDEILAAPSPQHENLMTSDPYYKVLVYQSRLMFGE